MTDFPKPFQGQDRDKLYGLVFLAIGQALSAATTTLATRDIFMPMSEQSGNLPAISLGLICFSGLMFAALRWLERVYSERIGQEFAARIRKQIFIRVARMSISDLGRFRSGGLTLRFVGDLAAIRNWISRGISRALSSCIVILVMLAVMFFMNPIIAITLSGLMALTMTSMIVIRRTLASAHSSLRKHRSRLATDITERLPLAPELAVLGRFQLELRKLRSQSQQIVKAAVSRQRTSGLVRCLPDVMQALAATLLLAQSVYLGLGTANAVAALAALGLLIAPVRDLAGVLDRHAAYQVARRRCERILDVRPVRRACRQGPESGQAVNDYEPPSLKFINVRFQKLNRINAEVPAGKKVGITGPSGSGKSTLLLLAAGLEVADQGKVTVGSTVRRRIEKYSHSVLYSGPRAPVVAGSLRRALTLGCSSRPTNEVILQTAKRAGLKHTIDRLGGIEGRLEENAMNLSSGEAGRLLLTRYALSDASLVVLDEPDEKLDYQSRLFLLQSIRQSPATTFISSHDWEVLSMMDEIWYVEDGRLIERGHPEVLKSGAGPTAKTFSQRLQA